MEPDFWAARWREGRIGFHEGAPNHFLIEHEKVLPERSTVFVPLCGKSEDLAYLAARGHRVIGVELVPAALEAFFAEHGLTPKRTRRGAFEVFEAESLRLIAGDFFALAKEDVGPVNAVYDRAAIIAVKPELRSAYADKLRQLVPAGADALVIALEYPQHEMEGPPFSVSEAELRRSFAGLSLEQLAAREWRSSRPGVDPVIGTERCFRLKF